MFIYKITNLINNKIYIGKTKHLIYKRWRQHIESSHNPKVAIHYAIRKYGENNFKINVIMKCRTFKELNENEKFYIRYYKSLKNGYNLTEGGDGNSNPTVETRNKVSKNHANNKGKNSPMYGKHPSKEIIRRLRLSHIGKKFSLETIKKMSIAKSGKNHPLYGKKHSIKTKEKMSLAKIGNKHPNYGKHLSVETRKKISNTLSNKIIYKST